MGLKQDAQKILNDAYQQALERPDSVCAHMELIDAVLDSEPKTYKYILLTALLAKATDGTLNPLCLQKGADLPGAYDARSLCHKVFVPFETSVLKKALGGSNEPFLNKPARVPALDKSNPARGGEGRRILCALCDGLPTIADSGDAFACLVYALAKLIRVRDEMERLTAVSIRQSPDSPLKLLEYMERALEKSYEGEILTLMVAGTYYLRYRKREEMRVEVHPVNQSGASGRDVSDLDIYCSGQLVGTNELKDKAYSETDVRHAADKAIQAGGTQMLFIEGPRGKADGNFVKALEEEYRAQGFLLMVTPCAAFFRTMLFCADAVDFAAFLRFVLQTARETKFKQEIIPYLSELAEEMFGLDGKS